MRIETRASRAQKLAKCVGCDARLEEISVSIRDYVLISGESVFMDAGEDSGEKTEKLIRWSGGGCGGGGEGWAGVRWGLEYCPKSLVLNLIYSTNPRVQISCCFTTLPCATCSMCS